MKIWIDGSGWNGQKCGYCVAPEYGNPMVVWLNTEYTNNEMEYRALTECLKITEQAEILSDSQLVVNQVNGKWRVKDARLFPLCQEAQRLMSEKRCTLTWIPREQNKAGFLLEK